MDVTNNNSDIGTCDISVLEGQVHDLQNTNSKKQVTSIPQVVAPHAVDQGQCDIRGIFIPCIHKMQGSPCVTSWMVDSLTTSSLHKELEVKSTFSTSQKSSSKIGSLIKLVTGDGSALDHQGIPGGGDFGNERNQDLSLQESRASSGSDPSLISGMSQSACFSKLLNKLKILVNHQRRSITAGNIIPGVSETFPPLFSRLVNHTYLLLSKSNGHTSSGNLITEEKSMAAMCTEFYCPHIINCQHLVPTAELTKQELSLQQKAFEIGGSNGMLSLSSSFKDVSMKITTLLPHTSATIPEVEFQSQGQELISRPNIHSTVSASVVSPIHSIVHSYNQEQTKALVDQFPLLIPISGCPSSQHKNTFTSAGSSLREDYGLYALSEQYSQLEGSTPFPLEQNNEDKKTGKALDIADAACESGLSMGAKCNQQAVYPHNWPGQVRIVSAGSTASSSEDARVLSFSSSQGNTDYSQVNNGYSESSTRVNGMHQVSSQLADLGMGQSTTNETLLALEVAAMYQRRVALRRPSVKTARQCIPGKYIDCLFPGTGVVPQCTGLATEEVLKESEPTLFVQISELAAFSPTEDVSTYRHSLSKSNIGAPVAVLPKKRKKVILPLIPWHIEISEAGDQRPTMSDVELAWATVTDHLSEKDKDDVQPHDEGGAASISRAKRRIKLATQLMQHLIPPLPNAMMSGKAIAEHEGAIYILAKTALGDACKLGSSLRAVGRLQKFKRLKDNPNLRMVGKFTGRAKDLHSKLLEVSSHISDLRSDYQDLERLSITNRLAKHHARNFLIGLDKGIVEGMKSSSNSTFSMNRPRSRRYVTAVPVPRILPETVPCYSL